MQFANREELLIFEKEREKYFYKWLFRKSVFEIYKLLFLETFHPKYRAVRKMYEDYNGGWYRNEKGVIFTRNTHLVPDEEFKEGDCCIEYGIIDCDEKNYREIYIYHNGMLIKI